MHAPSFCAPRLAPRLQLVSSVKFDIECDGRSVYWSGVHIAADRMGDARLRPVYGVWVTQPALDLELVRFRSV
eukprot:9659326-Lingulodinium_polyedra.AAC.1